MPQRQEPLQVDQASRIELRALPVPSLKLAFVPSQLVLQVVPA
jgi:hypothetical protein